MPECRCRNADAGMNWRTNDKTNDSGQKNFPVFRHSGISQKTSSVDKKELTSKDFVVIS
jgi:hypothetical protein